MAILAFGPLINNSLSEEEQAAVPCARLLQDIVLRAGEDPAALSIRFKYASRLDLLRSMIRSVTSRTLEFINIYLGSVSGCPNDL